MESTKPSTTRPTIEDNDFMSSEPSTSKAFESDHAQDESTITPSKPHVPQLLGALQTIIDLQAACIANLSRTARNRNRNLNKKRGRIASYQYISEATAKQRRELTELIELAREIVEDFVELLSSFQ